MTCPHGYDPETCLTCTTRSSALVQEFYSAPLYRVQTVESYDEDKRVERWHATYNAALAGICGNAGVYEALTQTPADGRVGIVHKICADQATMAHGPLVKP